MVAPSGRTKEAISLLTPSFVWIFFILTGSVPAEEQVVKPIAIASDMPRKNVSGLMCAETPASVEYTPTAWMQQPIAIQRMTDKSGSSTFGPFMTTTGSSRQKTPIGARRMIIAMIL